jgi:hypothetical protein
VSIQPIESSVLRSLSFASLIAASALLVAPPLQAQTTAAAEAPVRDAAVLKRMAEVGAFLRAQKHFAVKADAVIDEVLLSGQKLQFITTLDYQVSSPDKLRATVRSDGTEARSLSGLLTWYSTVLANCSFCPLSSTSSVLDSAFTVKVF